MLHTEWPVIAVSQDVLPCRTSSRQAGWMRKHEAAGRCAGRCKLPNACLARTSRDEAFYLLGILLQA